MATDVDSLRSTLDSLHLSPEAKADRPYLVSMLRRLGYSDAEINAYFQQPADTPLAASDPDDRLIEIEYTGPGLRDFSFVEPVEASEVTGLGAGLTAGEEVISAGPSMDEVDRLAEQGDLSDFGDTGFVQEQEEVTIARPPGEEETPPEGSFAEGTPEGTPETPAAAEKGEAPDDFKLGEGMVEFEAIEVNEGVAAPLPDPASEGWQPLSAEEAERLKAAEKAPYEEVPAELPEILPEEPIAGVDAITEPPAEAWEVVAEPPREEGYRHNDWTLYSKEADSPEGRQRIYFFSKGDPGDAEPAALPPGYEVSENERTGLPYLRRIGEEWEETGDIRQVGGDVLPGAKKKRVRVKRVRAATKEEAEGKIADQGGNPLASMPIDIEERWEP
ncbi:MAG: hypothetical protein ACYDBQ_11000 [Thermoplasmatota archaeon]